MMDRSRDYQTIEDQQVAAGYITPPPTPAPPWELIWTVLTEPRHNGLGEGPVTEGWLVRPEIAAGAAELQQYALPYKETGIFNALAEQGKKAAALSDKYLVLDSERNATKRKQANLRIDLRRPNIFKNIAETCRQATHALIDPYTLMLSEFSSVESAAKAGEPSKAGAYAYASRSNLEAGRVQLVQWNLHNAQSAFKKAIRSEYHNAEVWWHLGLVLLLRRRTKGAVKAFGQASSCAPGNSRMRLGLGLAHFHQRNYVAAAEAFGYEKGLDNQGCGARSFLACALRMQGKWAEARQELTQLAESPISAWQEMAGQCRRCIERAQENASSKVVRRSRGKLALQLGLAVSATGALVFSKLETIERLIKNYRQVDVGLLVVVALMASWLAIWLVRLVRNGKPGELFGDGFEDLPCWQTRTWLRPPKLDVFGQHLEMERR